MNENQENLLDHYSSPHNFGKAKFKANASAKLQNLSCGDELSVWLKIAKNHISKISFTGEGCSIAIGSASILFEDLIGKEVDDVLLLETDYVENLIGIPLTISRKKCANLSLETIKSALKQYQQIK